MFHTNTIEVLDGSLAELSPIFKRGNVLISALTMDMIAVVDMEEETVIWALTGQWIEQHELTLLKNGHILLFDNLGHQGMSRVIEIDPFTQKLVWAYEGTAENGFFIERCDCCQQLPNGNTLITESYVGRAFEVTPKKEIVWEYYNPARAGEKNELIATLFELVRLDPDFNIDWLRTSVDEPK